MIMTDIPNATTYHSDKVTYKDFLTNFKYQDAQLYEIVFAQNSDQIKTKKAKFAVINLQKLFTAMFEICSEIGFHEMSLRQLSQETGISMGGIYSCLTNKDSLAVMVKDIVNCVSNDIIVASNDIDSEIEAIHFIVQQHLFASTTLRHWFYFLFFETRSLSNDQLQQSLNIEIRLIQQLCLLINQGQQKGIFSVLDSEYVAAAILSCTQEWYLKPWKHDNSPHTVDKFCDRTLAFINGILGPKTSDQRSY